MAHDLPFEPVEDDYAADATSRYERIEDDLADRIGSADGAVGTSEFAATIATWIATRQRSHNLTPSSTLPTSEDEYEWFDRHAVRAYELGYDRARDLLESSGVSPGRTLGVERSPRHRSALQRVHERQRRYWNNLATDLRSEVQTTLASEVETGSTIQQASSTVSDRIEKTGKDRAKRIATYEPSWSFNRAMVEEYADAGVRQVAVDVSWETMADGNVCEECLARSGTYSISEARALLESGSFPAHPYGRCLLVPEA